MIRRGVCLLLAVCLAFCFPMTAEAAGNDTWKIYARQMIQYYRHHQAAAEDVIWDLNRQMAAVDPDQAAVWKNIMDDWAWVNEEMPVGVNVLPDGLPEDESLCIVVLGYGLAEDGSMKEELVDRLVVALSSALKYPNALIAVTGGQTSEVEGVTEAGQMAAWLRKKGIDSSRILVERQALSTTANAENVYKLLNEEYPQVKSVAVVTSDYHLTWGSALFAAVSNYNFAYHAGNPIDLVAGAVCNTGKTWDTMMLQAAGISAITGVPYDQSESAPALYPVDRPTEPETQPTETTEEVYHWFWQQPEEAVEAVQEQPEEKRNDLMIVFGGIGLGLLYILIPKKPRKKRKKPEFKWED